ncbi:MAG: hypothetical protein O9340_00715 [Cyclobacteriaceae bacterium]|jgi:hypothetical protein|nr:hypothetical protein [Cyclobacteriaceae bacterium]
MDFRDFIVTPIYLILLFFISIVVRGRLSDPVLKRYFLPALWLKVFGAIALGFLYQFYYAGGDTFNYHTYGSRIIWEAFTQDVSQGIRLILNETTEKNWDLNQYIYRILFYYDAKSFFIVRIAAIFDLLTFSTYSSTAIFFALFSFLGSWAFFLTFYREFPHLHKWLALAILFIPSVLFWGSGILKDTITLGALGLLTFSIHQIAIKGNRSVGNILLLLISFYLIFSVKKYILMCFLPAAFFWIYAGRLFSMGTFVFRILFLPFIIAAALVTGYWGVAKLTESDQQYSLDAIAKTARITAYDIRYYTGKDAGSGYSLGELDGSMGNMLQLAPAAVNVSLFRPYLWEVRNPLMLLSALESLTFLLVTIYLLLKYTRAFFKALTDTNILFCLVFSIVFAFGVGVSTYNFGTLARYKIPLLPYYALALVLLTDKLRNTEEQSPEES